MKSFHQLLFLISSLSISKKISIALGKTLYFSKHMTSKVRGGVMV